MEQEFRRLTMGSTHQTIYMRDVGSFVAPVPPLVEQDQIGDLYVRSGPGSVQLGDSDADEYVRTRFAAKGSAAAGR